MEFTGRELACERGGRVIFCDLGFALADGAALILRGANGAGKTSLLKIAASLLQPLKGELSWNGAPVAADPEDFRRQLAYLGHRDAVKSSLTVRENMQAWAAILAPGDAAVARIGPALDDFAIAHLGSTPAQHLSAGQRKRVALARLMIRPAPLWLLDEPTASLDDDGVHCLTRVVARHRAAGGMVIAATHQDLGIDAAAELRIAAANSRAAD